jgi:pyruvate,water dikinase
MTASALSWERWDDPAEAELTWWFDLTHFPDVMTPLGYDLYMRPFMQGFSVAMTPPGEPDRFLSRRVNGYLFMAHREAPKPDPNAPAPTIEERLAKLEGHGRKWREVLLPEIQRLIDHYRTTDFDALPDAALVEEIERLPEVRVRAGVLHDRALAPWARTMSLLAQTFNEYTGGDGVQAMRLVQGYGSKSTEAGHALWRLSRVALAIPTVRERLLGVDSSNARGVLSELEGDPTAAPFVEGLRAFLDAYGWRNDLFELATPSWAEDPTIPLCQLRAYLMKEDYDPEAEQARLAVERETFVRETLAALEPEKRHVLERVRAAAVEVASLQEDHNFYIDQRLALLPRRLILTAARRLVGRGQLGTVEDVFLLHAAELISALEGGAGDLRGLVRGRREEMTEWARLTPPGHIGAPPPPKEEKTGDGGGEGAPLELDGAVVLTGNGGSAGVARGPVRILRTLAEADRLRAGEVLVARTTMPPWTPLFAIASALVVEVGGILSHPAVTAREYGLPAVLNVRGATQRLRDGQLVEVDGTRGRVRLLT